MTLSVRASFASIGAESTTASLGPIASAEPSPVVVDPVSVDVEASGRLGGVESA